MEICCLHYWLGNNVTYYINRKKLITQASILWYRIINLEMLTMFGDQRTMATAHQLTASWSTVQSNFHLFALCHVSSFQMHFYMDCFRRTLYRLGFLAPLLPSISELFFAFLFFVYPSVSQSFRSKFNLFTFWGST